MRIQETNRILNESRLARHSVAQQHEEGVMSRAWKTMSSKLTSLFRKD